VRTDGRTRNIEEFTMQFFGPEQVADALPWSELITSIEDIFVVDGAIAPDRTVHTISVPGGSDAALLMKPGWVIGDVIAVKVVTFFPDNGSRDLPTVNGGVLLFSATKGIFLGACDGTVLTARRTAAASAVAAKRLARHDVQRLLVVGTGALGPAAAQAHSAVRSYASIEIWGRDSAKAGAVVATLRSEGLDATVSEDLDASVAEADVISCVTGSNTPLVKGALLKEGAHVDLIGAFSPHMRESDDDVIRRAQVWVDTRSDAVLAGDLSQPIESGIFSADDIQGDLEALIAGTCDSRSSDQQITMFKSVGTALEDVAAAKLVFGA
jgi:alanine dehydrogenase